MVDLSGKDDFLESAKNDKIMIELALPHVELAAEGICFHCQQMAEKMLKQVWVDNGLWPKRSHDLDVLIAEATENGWIAASKDELQSLNTLSQYGTKFKYTRMKDYERGEAYEALANINKIAGMLARNGYNTITIDTEAHYLRDEALARENESLDKQQQEAKQFCESSFEKNESDMFRSSDQSL